MSAAPVVVMSTHNQSALLPRALQSINDSMGSRPHAIVIVDNGSRDKSVVTARMFRSTARERLILAQPKTSSVAASKNRTLRAALPLLARYPWVLFMDDDDEMLPGRLDLLDRMEEEQQVAGVGDLHFCGYAGNQHIARGDWAAHTKVISPCATVIHRSLIPKDGQYFLEVPELHNEDTVTHTAMERRGVVWCYHPGRPVHRYHCRRGSVTTGPSDLTPAEVDRHSQQRHANSVAYVDARFPAQESIGWFCTIALGERSGKEAVLLRDSLRIAGNTAPLVVLADAEGRAQFGPDPQVEFLTPEEVSAPVESFERRTARFQDIKRMTGIDPKVMAAWSYKPDLIRTLLAWFPGGPVAYLDADFLVLRRFIESIQSGLSLTPDIPGFGSAREGSTWATEVFGRYNAGCIIAAPGSEYLVEAWQKEFYNSWRGSGKMDQAHGCFADQSSLDMLPLVGSGVQELHLGHNVFSPRFPRSAGAVVGTDPYWAYQMTGLTAGHGLYFRGWPVVSIHTHFRSPNCHPQGEAVFRAMLCRCLDPVCSKIAALL